MPNTTTPAPTVNQKIRQVVDERTITVGVKDGLAQRIPAKDYWKQKIAEGKSMTSNRGSYKEIQSQAEEARRERNAVAQQAYNLRQERREAHEQAQARLAKQSLSELPKPTEPVMVAKKRPKSYAYLSDTEKRIIDGGY